jgi:hypothetical protein
VVFFWQCLTHIIKINDIISLKDNYKKKRTALEKKDGNCHVFRKPLQKTVAGYWKAARLC